MGRFVGRRDDMAPQSHHVLSTKKIKRYRSGIHEVLYNGRPAISKIACFEWMISRIENETCAYSKIDQYQEAGVSALTRSFLAYLTENSRVINMLLEKLEGECASIYDLPACEEALRRLHLMGMIHGDVNRYNFVIDRSKKRVQLVDFEHTELYDESKAIAEVQSLLAELAETTGRGGPSRLIDSV